MSIFHIIKLKYDCYLSKQQDNKTGIYYFSCYAIRCYEHMNLTRVASLLG